VSEWRRILAAGAERLGIPFGEAEAERFAAYLEALLDWNRRVNLTRITEPAAIAVKHFLDSLTCLRTAPFARGVRVADVGSGAGLPGVALGIVRGDLRLTLIEASARRCEFLRHVVERVGLEGAEVACLRAEEAGRQDYYRESYEVVVSRAVARLAVLAEYALPLARVGGVFLAQKGPRVQAELNEAAGAIETLGGIVQASERFELPEGGGSRVVVVIGKESSTPARYPRRPGVPAKRPLGLDRRS
jgi:16S rRNA (guanine527-N7)-methyltransferase